MKKIALYARPTTDNHPEYLKLLVRKLSGTSVELTIHDKYYQWLKQNHDDIPELNVFKSESDFAEKAQMLISLGGDGTMLETLKFVKDSGIPVLGVNTGRLGFLASVAKNEFDEAIDKIVNDKFELDKRSVIKVESDTKLFGGLNYALNEVTIHKKDSSAMISIDAHVDGEFLNSYWADGLIISTATGSTAYSLSCGGPIMIPGSGNFCITPIAPHNLNVRPVVIGNNHTLELSVKGRSAEFLLTLDSRNATINKSSILTLSRADFTFNLIKLDGQSFFNTLRNKLLWGIDKRN
ncbi:MAG: NAD kinase [Bacteroidota bacterium]